MTNEAFPGWDDASQEVEAQFSKLSNSTDLVDSALRLLDLWMREDLCEAQRPAVIAHIANGRYDLLLDSFYQFIPFGTGGRRGRVGFGPNRINDVTVAMSVMGHCKYLHKEFPTASDLSVVVAYDVRIFKDLLNTYDFLDENPLYDLTSRKLAMIAAEIYAAHGVRCYFVDPSAEDAYLSTPELSFALLFLGAQGGVNMSASHNHPDDNGFKFYNAHGAQDVPPYDEALAEYMNQFEPLQRVPFPKAVAQGMVGPLPPEVHREYLALNLAFKRGTGAATLANGDGPPITYTSLCGTGRSTVEQVLRHAGHNVVMHEPDAGYDGTFPHVPFHLPNPEVPEAAWPAIETAERCGSSVVFSTDPDADRLGVLAKDATGRWHHLNGNEIAAILTYYMILDEERGPTHRGGLVIKTLVTTSLVERIAKQGGCDVIGDLLIGFKFIADVLRHLETEGRFNDVQCKASDLVLALEESHGYLLTHRIRDKDAAGPALMLADLVTALDREGRTLPEYLDEVAAHCGSFGNAARSILMTGIKGAGMLRQMMDSLRAAPPSAVGTHKVLQSRDFQARLRTEGTFVPDSSMAKSSDLLEFLTCAGRIIVRPSGTEPKIKIYSEVEASGNDRHDAKRQAESLALDMYRVCLKCLGPEHLLSAAAERIPDHVPLEKKMLFDAEFSPAFLTQAPDLARLEPDQLLDALRTSLLAYAKADTLQVFRPSLIELCSLAQDEAGTPLAQALDTIRTGIA